MNQRSEISVEVSVVTVVSVKRFMLETIAYLLSALKCTIALFCFI